MAILADKKRTQDALEYADLRVLLMVMYHLSQDQQWLQDPFKPKRDVQLIADKNAGFEPQIQAHIRASALQMLCDDQLAPPLQDPDNALMVELMSSCLGENVPPEYAPMMREQIGLLAKPPTMAKSRQQHPVIIVGAGISSIALAHALNQQGIDYIILEKNPQLGGTWWNNTYPGCGVDTPNHAYSFSFTKPYPWQRYFAPREQIQDYLEQCASDAQLQQHIRFNSEVTSARWDVQNQLWQVDVSQNNQQQTISGSALISAIGQLNEPAMPHFSGQQQFSGQIFHSAHWPADLDLRGKKVSIIGTGASSMQIVPTIVDEVAELNIYQRSAQWARPIPRYHDDIPEPAQWLLEEVPYYAAWFRFTMFWRYGDGLLPSLKKDPNWPHAATSLNRANQRHGQQMADHIRAELAGREDLIAKCMPNYPAYGKRILLDNGWYQALLKPQVELINDDVECITATGITDNQGIHREADIIILATGFQISEMAARLNLSGKQGKTLKQCWANDNPKAYLGITVPGFPNLFCMQGPNTGLGHGGSAIFQAECQAHYIAQSLAHLQQHNLVSMEVSQQAQDDYVARVDAEHETMIWTHPGMSTYYRNAAGRVISVMPWRLVDYWHMTRELETQHYQFN